MWPFRRHKPKTLVYWHPGGLEGFPQLANGFFVADGRLTASERERLSSAWLGGWRPEPWALVDIPVQIKDATFNGQVSERLS